MFLILCISSDAWVDFTGSILGSIISGLVGGMLGAFGVWWTIHSSHKETTRQIQNSINETNKQVSASNKQINIQIRDNDKHKRESISLVCMNKINSCIKSGVSIYKNSIYLSKNISKKGIKIRYHLLNSLIDSMSKEYKSVNNNMSDLVPYYIIFNMQNNDRVKKYRTFVDGVCLGQVFMVIRELLTLLNNVKVNKYGFMKMNNKILLINIQRDSKDESHDMKIMNEYLEDLMAEFKKVGFTN